MEAKQATDSMRRRKKDPFYGYSEAELKMKELIDVGNMQPFRTDLSHHCPHTPRQANLLQGYPALGLEVSGATGLHLTAVDLPGLIAVNEDNEDDVDIVTDMVETYLRSRRTIILAVVQAGNDIQNQSIIQKARKYDPSGSRTVGTIIKPDLINKNSEARVVRLAKNQDAVKLKLGFFLVENPSLSDIDKGWTASNHKLKAIENFSAKKWQSCDIDFTRAGIDNLRAFLQQLLDDHIEKELPKVQNEIKILLDRTERESQEIGEERPTAAHHRSFLTHLSMDFYNITRSALDGNYLGVDRDFFESEDLGSSTRLRARIHNRDRELAGYMPKHAKARIVQDFILAKPESGDEDNDDDQNVFAKKQMIDWVMTVCSCLLCGAAWSLIDPRCTNRREDETCLGIRIPYSSSNCTVNNPFVGMVSRSDMCLKCQSLQPTLLCEPWNTW
ncbi:hypothetical protein LTS18_009857 [Coniosporium uncinatum]|uniref:Uncharacterized protein n=1 Tax=Coniosporium uncinatum TaxID=93489 RepID=A0ACC3DA59_9PEZI|nr:hypothetical protein LTS18_009857 [Coniosporium uncinatum]